MCKRPRSFILFRILIASLLLEITAPTVVVLAANSAGTPSAATSGGAAPDPASELQVPDAPPTAPPAAPAELAPQEPPALPENKDLPEKEVKAKPTPPPRSGQEDINPFRDRNFADRNTYSVPLRFDPEDNGLSIENPQLKWLVSNDDKLDLGGLQLRSAMIGMSVSQILRDKVPARYDNVNVKRGLSPSRYLTIVSFRWPEGLAPTGDLSIETLDGKTVWSREIKQEDFKEWKTETGYATKEMMALHHKQVWGKLDVNLAEYPFLTAQRNFRFCFSNRASNIERLLICSRPYVTQATGEQVKLYSARTSAPITPGFTLNNRPMDSTGVLNFTFGTPFHIKMTYGDGSFVDLSTQPADPLLLDVVQGRNPNEILLTGIGAIPKGKVRVIKKPKTFFWGPTGFKQDRIWRLTLTRENPTVRILGTFNIPFTLLFNYDRVPKEADRVYVKDTHSTGTYSSNPVIEGYSPAGAKIVSNEISSQSSDAYHFEWTFGAPKRGEDNRARLLIYSPDQEKPWVAHYRQFRSYPYEFSARMTGIIDQSFTFIILGELSAAAWFDTLGFTNNSVLSKQRWGVATQYFKSLTPIKTKQGGSINDFAVASVDLKYNLIPGIWHRDEIVGLTLSFEQITLAGISARLAGPGIYWARTMPKIFNDIFNIIPVFEYPKYVDMQFNYYPLALESSTSPGATFNLTFHGRIFWTHQFYGEAGFGIREYQYRGSGQQNASSLSVAYGSAGLGFVF